MTTASLDAATEPGGDVVVTVGGVTIARASDGAGLPPGSSPKPFLHPLRALNGTVVTGFRPDDHVWHTGLALTLTDVSDVNFWGGPTFVRGDGGEPGGYTELDDHGRQRRDELIVDAPPVDHPIVDDGRGRAVRLRERLTWLDPTGGAMLAEQRTTRLAVVDARAGVWALDVDTRLTAVAGEALRIGSPTTRGRPDAGYGGLFWRGPASWAGGADVVAPDGDGGATVLDESAVRGTVRPWIAVRGDGASVLLAEAGGLVGRRPRWFVRTAEYAGAASNPAYDEELRLADGAVLALRYRLLVIDGTPHPAALAETAARWIGDRTRV